LQHHTRAEHLRGFVESIYTEGQEGEEALVELESEAVGAV